MSRWQCWFLPLIIQSGHRLICWKKHFGYRQLWDNKKGEGHVWVCLGDISDFGDGSCGQLYTRLLGLWFWLPESTLSQVQVKKGCSSPLFWQGFSVPYKKMYIGSVGVFMYHCKILLLVSAPEPCPHNFVLKAKFSLDIYIVDMQQSLVNLIIGFSLLLTCHITLATIFAPFPFLFYSLKESSDIFLSQPSESFQPPWDVT